jgi:glycosyltransferase involved in cell wall biosynthesis
VTRPLRVAVLADFPEEGWRSMDRVADRLLCALARDHDGEIEATRICPPFVRRSTRVWSGRQSSNLDRIMNRLVDYPRHLSGMVGRFDLFHVVDHSYAQLVHRLPPERTVVTCHDLDAFRSLLRPVEEPRSPLFRAMARHILSGLRRAAAVTCDTAAIRDELVEFGVVPAERTVVAPIGVGDEFLVEPDSEADREVERLLRAGSAGVEILHVGSTAPRKRLDVVLRCCAELSKRVPGIRLVRVGGPLTPELTQLAQDLDLSDRVTELPAIDDRLLASVYRRAAVLVLPSDREGFGLPVIEALACGTPVIAADLPVLREVGGPAATYCAGDRAEDWADAVQRLLSERGQTPTESAARRAAAVAWSRRFTWTSFGDLVAGVYETLDTRGRVLDRGTAPCPA